MAPKIHGLKYDEYNNEITFNIDNIDLSYVNALRRTILSSIPIWGIRGYPHEDRTIKFLSNTTKVDNE
jgi:DNA-directed RNA polymerase alpha subunit